MLQLSILSLIMRFLPAIPALETDIEAELKELASSDDNSTKLRSALTALQTIEAVLIKVLGG